jgi:adenosyl cobinamide kinase/adenosyl cobinamide phosphate guanylyltransferase
MDLFIGGSYQNKREFTAGLVSEDTKVVNHYHEIIREQIEQGLDPERELRKLILDNPKLAIICDEIGYGIVPMDKQERIYREAVGRTMCMAASMAESVTRIVCGIGMRIK